MFLALFLGISGHFNECPHRHNTNVRTDNPSKLSKAPGDSRRVLHLNSLTILVVMTIYTLRNELRRDKLSSRQNVSERCSNILEHITYKPFEESFEESGFSEKHSASEKCSNI